MLNFEPTAHRYTWNKRTIPSVTQALEPLFDFSSVPYSVLERKRQIGTQVHHAIEAEILDGNGARMVDADAMPYFTSWCNFRSECDFQPVLVEHRVTSDELGERYRYGGTLDEWGLLQHHPALIDWKTCLQLNTTAVGAQTAAYLKALVREGIASLSDRRFALKLGANGRYQLVRFRALSDDWGAFVFRLKEHVLMQEAAL